MKNIIYIIAVILIIFWVVGFFTHLAGFSIHALLFGALALILINVIQDDHNITNNNTPENI